MPSCETVPSLPRPVPRACPVCAGAAAEFIHDHALAPVKGVSPHAGYRVVACRACGMVYADAIPGQAAFDRYYRECSRYEDGTRLGLPGPVNRERFRAIAGELAGQLRRRDLSVAEMGASTGGLLAELKALGFGKLLAVDPADACVRAARELHGLEAAAGTAFDPLPGSPHDLVIAVGVLEHLRDLDRALDNLATGLAPDGLLYLEVPDLEGFHLTNEAPYQEFSTEHINFFTRRSLDNLMGCKGFRPAFGHVADRAHGGGSTMRVLAWAYRRDGAAAAPVPDPAGAAAARRYLSLCAEQARPEQALMERLARNPEPFAVWGAGTVACRLMATSALGRAPVAAFVDSNPHLQSRTLGGVPVQPPQWLRGFRGPILVASRGYAEEIRRTIREELGLANPLVTL